METDLDLAELPRPADLVIKFAEEHVADVVEALNDYPDELGAEVLALLPLSRATDVFDMPGLDSPAELIKLLPEERAAAVLEGMSADRRADIFRLLSEPPREALLARLSPEARDAVTHLLAYPEGSAGSLMTTEFVSVLSTATVGQTLHYIRVVERTRETVYSIYVLDPKSKKLVKSVSLRQLIAGDPNASILSVAPPRKPVTATPLMDQEEVASTLR